MSHSFDYSTLFYLSPLPNWVYEIETYRILDVNQAAVQHYGYSREEFLNMTIKDLRPIEDIPKVIDAHKEIEKREENIYFGVFTHQKKNGEKISMDINGHKVDFNEKKCMAVICQDVTTKKKEEQHLKLLESVITNTNDAVMITEAEPFDEPGPKIIYVNEAFTRMTGYTSEEVIGKSPRILQGPKSDREELARLGRAIRKWESCEITTINYKKNGDPFWINNSVSPVANEHGWYTHFIAIERDVTSMFDEKIQKDLLARISEVFNVKDDLKSSLDQLGKLIADFGEYNFCEIWLPTIHKNALKLFSRHIADTFGKTFYQHAEELNEIGLEEGLPGTVWKEKIPVTLEEVGQNEIFVRKHAAKKTEIRTVFGLPLIHQGEMVGVMLVGTQSGIAKIRRHQMILTKLESYIGSEINRKRLEGDLSHLFEVLPDIICLADFKGRYLKMNKTGCELLGYSEDEIVGSQFEKFVHPADLEISKNEISRLKECETVLKFENRCITKNGKTVWLSWSSNSSLADGVIYATAKDVTEEKKLKELVNDATKMARIGGWEIDLVNDKIHWSEIVHQIHETDPKSFEPTLEVGINFYREDFRVMVSTIIDHTIATGEPADFEAPLITAKGNQIWVRVICNAEFSEDKCIRVFGSFQDIDNRKKAELRLQAITDDLPGVAFQYVIFPDGKDQMRNVSKASKRIWGLPYKECEQNNELVWQQIKKAGEYGAVKDSIEKSIKSGNKWNFKWRNISPKGEIRWHEGFGTPNIMADGTVIFNSMVFDITEEIKATNLYEETSLLAKIGSWELDLKSHDGNDNMYWSPMVKKILEVEEDYNPTLTGGLEFYKEESRNRIKNAVDRLIQEGAEFDEELLIITKSGKEKWIRCIGKSERVDGVCSKIFGSFQDIHTLKSTALQLEEILGSISDAFYAADRNWNFTYFNKEAENLLKRKKEDLLGKNIWEEFAPAKGTILETIYRRVALTGKSESFEYYYPGDGSWYEINVYPSNGGVSSYFKNIDNRKKSAEELQKAYDEKNKILESIGDAFFALDKDWTVTYWNKRAEEIIGVPREDLIGKNLWEEFPLAKDLEFFKQYRRSFETQTPVNFQEYFPPFDQWYEANCYPSPDGISVFFRDISFQKKHEQELHELNQMLKKNIHELETTNEQLEQFAFIASHDLQEPLRMISSFLNLLQRNYRNQLDHKAHQYIYFATDGAKRMKRIILDLLEYSRAGKFSEDREIIHLDKTLEEYLILRKKVIEEKSVKLTIGKLPKVVCFKAPLVQTIHSLLDNAIKYSKEDILTEISLTVREDEEEWTFEIKDNGIGIDPMFFDKIFIIFQRLHNRDQYDGTGIGLAIAKKHVESWGGKIWVESEPGTGSRFYFTIKKQME